MTVDLAAFSVALEYGLRDVDAECCAAGIILRHPEATIRFDPEWFTNHEPRRIVETARQLLEAGQTISIASVCAKSGLQPALVRDLADPISEHRWDADISGLVKRLSDLFSRRGLITIGRLAVVAAHAASDLSTVCERLRHELQKVAK